MNLLFHILAVSPLVYYLYPQIGFINSLFLFLGGWAFDVDHYLYCIFKHRNFSLGDCYKFHTPFAKEKDLLHIFHVIEFYLLVLAIGLFVQPALYLFFGLVYHISLDFIKNGYLKFYKRDPRANNCRAYSLILWLKRHNHF